MDEPSTSKVLAERLGLAFPVLSDPGGPAIKAFGVFDDETEIAWPSIFVIDADGTIAHRWLADTYKERIATPEVMRALEK